MELFEKEDQQNLALKPLAERMRPANMPDFIGQEHIVSEGGLVQSMIERGKLRSLILWGPPGSGKTTLAHLIARESKVEIIVLNAISSGVQDVRKAIDKGMLQAKHYGKQVILFIDEIHRFNKSQQDSLLHAVETGDIVLVGASTENPSFEVNSPLLSRCQVLQLRALDEKHIEMLIQKAVRADDLLKTQEIDVSEDAMYSLIHRANGDARVALNILETAIEICSVTEERLSLTLEHIQEAAQRRVPLYDKKGEFHYDVISAFIKSLRGSDPSAAVYYMAVMLEGGEDIEFIARRMVILASEDVGNADPQALILATSCLTAIQNIGMPEARIILSQTACYLAAAPKSNASYLAIKAASKVVKEQGFDVPLHLRNAPTKLMKDLGYGRNYQYPHDFEKHFVKEEYLPDGIRGFRFYSPTKQGQEEEIRKRLLELWDRE
ncbi:MAG: replication-associated recombination protein A [Spirochaetota bacterium]|nr:replication-associated recombination protein A [Spirochaetota bacterium]